MQHDLAFSLRPWTFDDLPDLLKNANNQKIAANLTDHFKYPYTIENGKAFLEMANSHNPIQIFAIEINKEAVGSIGIHPQTDIMHKNAELGYWLAEKYWGQGIISGAISEMVAYGFNNFPINRIFARPFGSNTGSQRALEKAGFKLEAHFQNTIFKNGKYEDELVYALRKKIS